MIRGVVQGMCLEFIVSLMFYSFYMRSGISHLIVSLKLSAFVLEEELKKFSHPNCDETEA